VSAGHDRDDAHHGLGRHVRSIAGFWRSAINDHVVDTAGIGPRDVVLDIGAGLGAATVPAVLRGATVTAVDPSTFMRSALRLRRLWQRGRDRIRVKAGTAEHLPLENASVDVAVAVNTMHHWADMNAAAAELRRVLRPGGRVVLVDEDFDDPDHVMASRTTSHNTTYPMIDPNVVAEKLSAAGLPARSSRLTVATRPLLQVTARAQG
jgi:ubiquinone/menaquinone biosynthesis C-methylase UbiE